VEAAEVVEAEVEAAEVEAAEAEAAEVEAAEAEAAEAEAAEVVEAVEAMEAAEAVKAVEATEGAEAREVAGMRTFGGRLVRRVPGGEVGDHVTEEEARVEVDETEGRHAPRLEPEDREDKEQDEARADGLCPD
jgi:D-gamma-glutamyl-meso-diaminopimelic acid endopeptidase CwlS